MWFSYPNDENWIALDIARVKEVQKLNKEGIKPEYLKEEIAEADKPASPKVFDYENVVGQDSLTRLDNKGGRNKKNNKKNRNKPKGASNPNPANDSRQNTAESPKVQAPNPQVRAEGSVNEKPEGSSRNNKRRKNFRNNSNRERPAGDKPSE